ncbi:UBAP1-MVB12-associated (UMA)-domain containing protein 1 [Antennarius striatus]|uniref:UBAP1-MVB12-associated (UMA)-domain containing protein 1 n=1 Tax=Antennarius striatus TaxID=241820 RepID=UPI0035B4559D
MFSFLGLRKDSKKSAEKETDGGFVIIGETVEEQRRKMQSMNITQLSTNVVVQPSKSSCPVPAQPTVTNRPAAPPPTPPAAAASVEAVSTLPDLLGDVPFALAPHIQAMQAGFALMPDVLLLRDVNYKLAGFQYDFTLENSVLHNA